MTNLNAANISKLIWLMQDLRDERFTMTRVVHDCGAPACVLGHGMGLFGRRKREELLAYSRRNFGPDAYSALFSDGFHDTIHTPQQWALHARKVLAEAGLEVVPNTEDAVSITVVAQKERRNDPGVVGLRFPADGEAAERELIAPKQVQTLPSSTPAPYDFQAFWKKVLEPVKGEVHADNS